MSKLTFTKFTAVLACSLTAAAVATAAPASAALVPLVPTWRVCDFTKLTWLSGTGTARAEATVGSSGGTVVAAVDIAAAQPNTHYNVRIIQVPRPSIGCAPGAPGVTLGSLQTDGLGRGGVTLHGPVEPGKTGAWVIVERPAPFSQAPAEFYTSGFVAAI